MYFCELHEARLICSRCAALANIVHGVGVVQARVAFLGAHGLLGARLNYPRYAMPCPDCGQVSLRCPKCIDHAIREALDPSVHDLYG